MELAEEFEGQVTCFGENTEKNIIFSVSIKKEVKRIGKNGEKIAKAISLKLKFIGIARFMASSYQILSIISLWEFIKLNENMDVMIKNEKRVELNAKIVSAVLNTQALKII